MVQVNSCSILVSAKYVSQNKQKNEKIRNGEDEVVKYPCEEEEEEKDN